jgi:hypothetical protein
MSEEQQKQTEQSSIQQNENKDLTETEKLMKIKSDNDALEKELARQDYLRAKMELGGRALAGQKTKTPEEEAEEEANKMLKVFGR